MVKPSEKLAWNRCGNVIAVIDQITGISYEFTGTAVDIWEMVSAGLSEDRIEKVLFDKYQNDDVCTDVQTFYTLLISRGFLVETE